MIRMATAASTAWAACAPARAEGANGGTSTCAMSGWVGRRSTSSVPNSTSCELLALAQPGVDDLDVGLGELGETSGDVGDADRLAHVEDEDLARAADAAGLDEQLDGLVDRHEEPRDVGIGDRDRATGRDLGLERVEHRAPAAEHVAEAHRQEDAVGATGDVAR